MNAQRNAQAPAQDSASSELSCPNQLKANTKLTVGQWIRHRTSGHHAIRQHPSLMSPHVNRQPGPGWGVMLLPEQGLFWGASSCPKFFSCKAGASGDAGCVSQGSRTTERLSWLLIFFCAMVSKVLLRLASHQAQPRPTIILVRWDHRTFNSACEFVTQRDHGFLFNIQFLMIYWLSLPTNCIAIKVVPPNLSFHCCQRSFSPNLLPLSPEERMQT